MNYSDELVFQLESLGIPMSGSPLNVRYALEQRLEQTKKNSFGYLEGADVLNFDSCFQVVYGIEMYGVVRKAYSLFMDEYTNHLDETDETTTTTIESNEEVTF